jgi:hypothetical protein
LYDSYVVLKDTEIKDLLLSKENLGTALSTTLDTNVLAKIKEVIDNLLSVNEITREVISRFIEKVEVKEDSTVKLFYRFSGSSRVLNKSLG